MSLEGFRAVSKKNAMAGSASAECYAAVVRYCPSDHERSITFSASFERLYRESLTYIIALVFTHSFEPSQLSQAPSTSVTLHLILPVPFAGLNR